MLKELIELSTKIIELQIQYLKLWIPNIKVEIKNEVNCLSNNTTSDLRTKR